MLPIVITYTILFGLFFGFVNSIIYVLIHDLILCKLFDVCFFEISSLCTIFEFSIIGSLISLLVLFLIMILVHFIWGRKIYLGVINKKIGIIN
ncbi:hypothetical protein QJ854_gp160 [Moumouvirus goulette]|uniref:Uncharacterized protein n=1 Tax=Moumouvirus goulette TaxID=1247379 RepID=M1PXW5_9VIRU|nr:hypothetical protein QJ854_gp160 [Moumouvirus goulette]AGF85622.1 hypothetical protein glt_00817 [Moumouvirus goulette]